MLDDTTKQSNKGEYALVILAGAVMAASVFAILFIFLTNTDSQEIYHGYYLMASLIFTGASGVAIVFKRYVLSILAIVIVLACLAVSIAKFETRADINALIRSSEPTILTGYVREVPPLEKRILPFFNTPKLLEFDRDCFRPALQEEPNIASECASREAIFNAYKVNINQLMSGYYNKLHNTAMRVRNQEFMDRASLEGCIEDGFCAEIPLLPANVNPDLITAVSTEYQDLRQLFWLLVDNPNMPVEYCNYMDLCRAMSASGAVDRRDFQVGL